MTKPKCPNCKLNLIEMPNLDFKCEKCKKEFELICAGFVEPILKEIKMTSSKVLSDEKLNQYIFEDFTETNIPIINNNNVSLYKDNEINKVVYLF